MPTEEVVKRLERSLKGKSYPEIERTLAQISPHILIQLLDCRSIRIGDSAAGLLSHYKFIPLVISAIVKNRILTKFGNIRAQSVLFGFGRQYPDALKAYLVLLKNKNDEVARNALLPLVYWGDKRVIPLIKERRELVKSWEDRQKEFELACEALEKANPSIFNPHFVDGTGIWK